MKQKLRIIAASALAAVCLAVPASAYLSVGTSTSYEVTTAYPNWNNKGESAWILNSSSNCQFSATKTSGTGKATFAIYQWTTGNDYERGKWTSVDHVNATDLIGNPVASDDYYSKVTLTSGTSLKGNVKLSKK